MFKNKDRDWHVPRFSRPPEKNFEFFPARLTTAIEENGLVTAIDSTGNRDDAASPEERLAKQIQARSVIVRALGDSTLGAVTDCGFLYEMHVKLKER